MEGEEILASVSDAGEFISSDFCIIPAFHSDIFVCWHEAHTYTGLILLFLFLKGIKGCNVGLVSLVSLTHERVIVDAGWGAVIHQLYLFVF